MRKEEYRVGREEPVVCYCEREHPKPGSHYGPVIRNIYIVECCTGGWGSVVINGRDFPVEPGSCYVLLPGDSVIHTADGQTPRQGLWCAIDGLSVGRHLNRAGITSESPFVSPEAFGAVCSCLERMVTLWQQEGAGVSLQLTACIYELLGVLVWEKQSGISGEEWVERAVGIMESCCHEPLSVAQIAKETGLERAYFSTLFKEKTGVSPHRYLTQLRIRKACGLLELGDCSIGDVARSVGLDQRNFARIFKKETGKTPFEYKAEHNQNAAG